MEGGGGKGLMPGNDTFTGRYMSVLSEAIVLLSRETYCNLNTFKRSPEAKYGKSVELGKIDG